MSACQKTFAKQFVRSMKRIAKDLSKAENEITKAEFFSNDSEEIPEWTIRKSGGFNSLKKLHFPEDVNLDDRFGSRLIHQHRNKLDKAYGEALFFERELLAAVKEVLQEQKLIVHPPVKLPKKITKTNRTIVAAISDTHFGANISKGELHGLNEFNWTVASRRLAHYMEQVVHYKEDHRDETDLVLQLNGDIIAGLIHNQEWFVDLLTTQFVGTINILTQAISYAAGHFKKVKVVCTTGNHGRNVGKADKGRATTHKWDSYEHMIYVSLREILKGYKNIEFLIPEAPLAVYKVQGHNVVQTHGDTVINVGNPGKSLNIDAVSNQINQLNSSELLKPEEKAAVVCVGHVHVPTTQILNNGCFLMINGCLSGVDPFAQSIGIFSNNPTQVIFEATKRHAVGDIRYVQVKQADNQDRFDAIIKPFQGKF